MRKKAIVLRILYISLVAVASIGLFMVKLTGQAESVNSQVISLSSYAIESGRVDASSLGDEVMLEGNLTGPVGHIPEGAPPWNYMLITSEGVVGIHWICSDDYDSVSVRIYGVAKEGRTADAPGWNGTIYWNGSLFFPSVIRWNDESVLIYRTCYYVEAERIELL